MALLLFEQARVEMLQALPGAPSGRTALVAMRGTMMLTPAQAQALARRLRALVTGLGRPGRKGGGTRRYSLTIALLPADGEAD